MAEIGGSSPSIAAGSPQRFGYSWDRYNEILPQHEEQFLRWTAALGGEYWGGLRFLDAGCGIGRNSFWAMKRGASGGAAIDVDERTLTRARANLAAYPQVEVRRQSIYSIGEQDEFDLAFSIGVIHHLEFPEKAVAGLVRSVKSGGRVMLWLYGRENNSWIVRVVDPLRKALFSRMPLRLVHAISWPITAGLWLALRIGLEHIEYFRLIKGFSFQHLRAIVFDHMIPKIARYYTRQEAVQLLQGAGLIEVNAVWVNQMSWSVSGVKPSPATGCS